MNHNLGNVKSINPDRVSQVTYTTYKPTNLNLNAIIEANPPVFNFKWHIDELYYLIGLIYNNHDDEDSYSRINAELATRHVKNFRHIMAYLENNGIIYIDKAYIKGVKSRGYKFTSIYQTEAVPHSITHQRLIKKILKFYSINGASNKFIDDDNRDLSYLHKWFTDGKLKINYTDAKKHLEEINKVNVVTVLKSKRYNLAKQSVDFNRKTYLNELRIQLFNSRHMPLLAFHRGNFNPKLDYTAGRLHSVLTQLKSDLRPFIKYDDKPLVAVDIVNCQPYLLASFLNAERFNKMRFLNLIGLYNPQFLNCNKKADNLLQLIESASEFEDTQLFISHVKSGKFYEEFSKSIGGNLTRNEVKKFTFSSLFAPNEKSAHIEGIKIFNKLYPTVGKIIKAIKSGKGKHNTLACSLQRLEAHIILHKVCRKIHLINPEIPLFTLHDSIITTPEHKHIVRDIMIEELTNFVGIKPTLKLEQWNNIAT